MTDDSVKAFRGEQLQRLQKIIDLHADEPSPKWKLFQKLANICSCRDDKLAASGLEGFLLHGPLHRCGQWALHPKREQNEQHDVNEELSKVTQAQQRMRKLGSTRGVKGHWPLPGKHEDILLEQLREGARKNWYSMGLIKI